TVRFRECTQRRGRGAGQDDAGDAFGVQLGRRGDHTGHDRRGVLALGSVHRDEYTLVVEVVFDELALRAREHGGQLVRVGVAAAGGPQHLLSVVVQRQHGFRGRFVDVHARAVARVEGDPYGHLGQITRRGALTGHELYFFQPRTGGGRKDALDKGVQLVHAQFSRRPHVHQDSVGVEPFVLRALHLDVADRVQTARERVLQGRQRDQAALVVTQ